MLDGDVAEIDALVADQPAAINMIEMTFDEFYALAFKSTQARFALDQLAKKFKDDCDALTGATPVSESLSWQKQEQYARAYIADPTQPAPQLDALALSRGFGETAVQLADKIVTNVAAYETAYFGLLGQYQASKKAIFEA